MNNFGMAQPVVLEGANQLEDEGVILDSSALAEK